MKDIKTFKDLKSIVITFVTAILFFSCNSNEGTVVFEDPKVSPQGVAENFILYYTETAEFSEIPMEVAMGGALKKDARLIAILRSSKSMDYQHLAFPYRTFPDGLVLEVFDSEGKKSAS